jgi:hypothetical protein
VSTRKYRTVISWTHRKWGPQSEKLAAEGSSIRRAINAALLGFLSDAGKRKDRRDAHAHIRVKAWRTKE